MADSSKENVEDEKPTFSSFSVHYVPDGYYKDWKHFNTSVSNLKLRKLILNVVVAITPKIPTYYAQTIVNIANLIINYNTPDVYIKKSRM